jgi:hypothetical protein
VTIVLLSSFSFWSFCLYAVNFFGNEVCFAELFVVAFVDFERSFIIAVLFLAVEQVESYRYV